MTDMDDLTPEGYAESISYGERTLNFKCEVCKKPVPITVKWIGRGHEVYHICNPDGEVIGTPQGNDQLRTFYTRVKLGQFIVRCKKCKYCR